MQAKCDKWKGYKDYDKVMGEYKEMADKSYETVKA